MTDIEFELPSSMLPDTGVEFVDDDVDSNVPTTDDGLETPQTDADKDDTSVETLQDTLDPQSENALNETPSEANDDDDERDGASEETIVAASNEEETLNDNPDDGLKNESEVSDETDKTTVNEEVIEIDWPSMVDKYSKMFTTKQLRDKLRDNGLVTSGTKGQMISRLHEHGVSLEDDDDSIEVSS